jgi:hypothetical protein
MNISTLKRDPNKVKEVIVKNNGVYITKAACSIYIPVRYADKGMIILGEENYFVGVFAIVIDGYYSVTMVNSLINIGNPRLSTVTIDDMEYYKADFEPGTVVFKRDKVLTNNKIPFKLFNDMLSRGYVPFYLNYDDLGSLLNTSKEYAGVGFTENVAVFQLIVSLLSRAKGLKDSFYRQVINSYDDITKNPPNFVALYNVNYSASNTLSKLTGSYFTEGIVSSLVTPTKKVERIEELLRA